jgi:hypothetical protein
MKLISSLLLVLILALTFNFTKAKNSTIHNPKMSVSKMRSYYVGPKKLATEKFFYGIERLQIEKLRKEKLIKEYKEQKHRKMQLDRIGMLMGRGNVFMRDFYSGRY